MVHSPYLDPMSTDAEKFEYAKAIVFIELYKKIYLHGEDDHGEKPSDVDVLEYWLDHVDYHKLVTKGFQPEIRSFILQRLADCIPFLLVFTLSLYFLPPRSVPYYIMTVVLARLAPILFSMKIIHAKATGTEE